MGDRLPLGEEHHTYTIIGRCHRTGRLGIGIATYSLAVCGYCPFIRTDVAALSTQAYASPQLGPLAFELLEEGRSPAQALEVLAKSDEHFGYRQIGIVDRDGAAAAHTGPNTRTWAGHVLGDGYVSMGNALAGPKVIEGMAQAFEASLAEDLDERLLLAIEAGRESGGQGDLWERSAGVMVNDRDWHLNVDLRVDAHDSAVDELRADDPPNTPLQEDWSKQQGIE